MLHRFARILVLVLLLAAAGWVAAHWSGVESRLAAAGGAGVLPFAAAFVALTMGCFPVSVLAFTAGAVYGPGPGFLLVVPAVFCGGLLMFLLGRSLLREPIRRRVAARPRWRALEDLAAAQALRLNVLARLSPFNYGLVCYTLAAGRTPLRLYLLGLLGTLPSLAAHVLVGSVVRRGGAALDSGAGISRLQWAGSALAIVALLVLSWVVGRISLAAWRQSAPNLDPQHHVGKERDEP